MNQKDDYYYLHHEIVQKDLKIKFFVENYGPTLQLLLVNLQMIEEFLKKNETFHKNEKVTGIMKVFVAGSLAASENAVRKNKRKMISGVFNFEYLLKHSIPMMVNKKNSINGSKLDL